MKKMILLIAGISIMMVSCKKDPISFGPQHFVTKKVITPDTIKQIAFIIDSARNKNDTIASNVGRPMTNVYLGSYYIQIKNASFMTLQQSSITLKTNTIDPSQAVTMIYLNDQFGNHLVYAPVPTSATDSVTVPLPGIGEYIAAGLANPKIIITADVTSMVFPAHTKVQLSITATDLANTKVALSSDTSRIEHIQSVSSFMSGITTFSNTER